MEVYLDHAATTPVYPEVVEVMSDFLLNHFGNPSSLHHFGVDARGFLDKARQQVADLINAQPDQIYFTSGGTEADNIAVFGCALEKAAKEGKKHIITSGVEHHAILESCLELRDHQGFDLTILPVDKYGMVHPDTLREAMRDDTALVTIMHANNEVGTVNPIKELAAVAHERGAVFHTDAVQSVGKIECDVAELGVDMLTYSSHKINGPKGVGVLYKKPDIQLYRRVFGGGQERKLRSGTENMPGIVGFGKAAQITAGCWRQHAASWSKLRDRLVKGVLDTIPLTQLNGHPEKRLPHNANISFDCIEGEALLLYLNNAGIACSSGSACSSGQAAASHVLTAMGLQGHMLSSGLRFTVGLGVTEEQIEYTLDIIRQKVDLLRAMSPFYKLAE